MKRNTTALVLAILLVIPIAPVLYALLGGGVAGGVACLLLGMVASLATRTVVYAAVEFWEWRKYRDVYVEPPKPMPIPTSTAYEIDWTKINKDDRL